MTRFLLAGATAVLALVATPSAQAALCDLKNPVQTCRATVGELACGEYGEKCGIQRCYPMTDYPTCLY